MRAFLLLTVVCLFSGCNVKVYDNTLRPKQLEEARSYIGLTYSEVVGEKGVVYKRAYESNPPHGRVKLDDGTSYGYVNWPSWSQIFFDKDNRVYRIKTRGNSPHYPKSGFDISAPKSNK
tara:strand:- start:282 stop:638 length:357 start_codon:yes stop_codon:yes gene_type:complete